MPRICRGYAGIYQVCAGIYQVYAGVIKWNCSEYIGICQGYGGDLPKILDDVHHTYPRYTQNMPKICPIYDQYMHNICRGKGKKGANYQLFIR